MGRRRARRVPLHDVKATHQTRAVKGSQAIVDALGSRGMRPKRHAVFIPTERMVLSQLRSAIANNLLSLPITYELFADWIDLAATVEAEPDHPGAALIASLSEEALGGHVRRRGEQWKWVFRGRRRETSLDLDMASSGQRANWSIGYLGRALFALRERKEFAHVITVFVEEPELHLHPEAQVRVMLILAVLVNAGFRVVVTTHSLNLVYEINNLMLASRRLDRKARSPFPSPLMRLRPEDVSAYSFSRGEPSDVLDREAGFIDEHDLGDIGSYLGAEMNALLNAEA